MKLLLISLILTLTASAGHRVIAADTGTKEVIIIDEKGKIIWSFKAPGKPEDLEVLKNGNILLCTKNSVIELTMDKKIIWKFEEKGEMHSCQRLANGNTLIGHTSTGELLEVNKEGKVVKTIKTTSKSSNKHRTFRRVRKNDDGIYVSHHGDGVCRLYSDDGKILRTVAHYADRCFSSLPMKGEKLLLSGKDKIKIVDKDGKTVWEVDVKNYPDLKIDAFTAAIPLENGNILVTNWMGHLKKNKRGDSPSMVEISPDKKMVWSWSNPKHKCLIAIALIPE